MLIEEASVSVRAEVLLAWTQLWHLWRNKCWEVMATQGGRCAGHGGRTAAPLGAPTTPDVEPWLAERVILMIRAADLTLETGHRSSSDGKKLAVRTSLGVP